MSCGPTITEAGRLSPIGLFAVLSDEGFRLFFPVSTLYAALFPLLWVLVWSFDLPFANTVPASLWHGHEMMFGAFGAALIGFLTTAVPEWTDTDPPRRRPLWILGGLWLCGRCVGLLGWDNIGMIGALADAAWLAGLIIWLFRISWRRRTDRLLAFAGWVILMTACFAMTRLAFLTDNMEAASQGLYLSGLAFLGLLGLALSRITVPVTNLVLDPTERTSPFRPHPGRFHLAPGLILVAMVGEVMSLSQPVNGFLLIAAGAAFVDRVAEAFIGRRFLHAEILLLAGSSLFAGAGLMMAGAANLGAPWLPVTGLHVAFMGGLGLGVYAVFCIAGLLHTGRSLGVPALARLGAIGLTFSVILRVLPDLGYSLPGSLHSLAVLLWAAAFLCWLVCYFPMVSKISPR